MKLKVAVNKGEDGFWVASCPALRGCWSQGHTEKEALENIREAIDLYLEPDPKDLTPKSNLKIVELTV